MSAEKTVSGVDDVYSAARVWVDRALKADDSLFDPGKPIWSKPNLEQLRGRLVDGSVVPGNGFYGKLENQLVGASPEVCQLMAEVLYVQSLSIWQGQMKGESKRRRVEQVLGWGAPVSRIPEHLRPGLDTGIASSPAYGFVQAIPNRLHSRIRRTMEGPERRRHRRFAAAPSAVQRVCGHVEFQRPTFE